MKTVIPTAAQPSGEPALSKTEGKLKFFSEAQNIAITSE